MELGFETIGNATLIVHDREPVLVTDPWFEGDAYFGSWRLSHEVPEEQVAAIEAARFCWVSHGHPDHLSLASLRRLRGAVILMPDHVGGRIASALRSDGFDVRVMADRTWVNLSARVRVCSIADYNQDAVLLVDVGGRLVMNVNDSTDHGWRRFVRTAAEQYDISFLLQLSGFGSSDMINVVDEEGMRIPSLVDERVPPGIELSRSARRLGARYVIPFSSMHRYQRADSVWANEHVAGLDDYGRGFDSTASELLPPFIRYDCIRDSVSLIDPAERQGRTREPAEFGDDWSEPLETEDRQHLDSYLRRVAHLGEGFEFIGFEVGGSTHRIEFPGRRGRASITFAAPRTSLMTAVRNEVFDDLLIGNFMRTIVHGAADSSVLYPHFTPYLCKYADNGGARSRAEVAEYLRAYRHRAPFDYLRHRLERMAVDRVRGLLPVGSPAYRLARRAYRGSAI